MIKGLIIIDKEKCKGCGLCLEACPHHLIGLGENFNKQGYRMAVFDNSDKCTGCTLCALTCPDVAIEVYREDKDEQKNNAQG